MSTLGLIASSRRSYPFLPWRTVGSHIASVVGERVVKREGSTQFYRCCGRSRVRFLVSYSAEIGTLMLVAATILLMPSLFIFSTWVKSIDQFIGDLSYPIYISHVFVITAVVHVLTRMRITSPIGLILSVRLLMVLVVAYLLKVQVADRVGVLRRRVRRSGAKNTLQPTFVQRGTA